MHVVTLCRVFCGSLSPSLLQPSPGCISACLNPREKLLIPTTTTLSSLLLCCHWIESGGRGGNGLTVGVVKLTHSLSEANCRLKPRYGYVYDTCSGQGVGDDGLRNHEITYPFCFKCIFYYPTLRHNKGPYLNDVYKIFRFFDPLPPLVCICLIFSNPPSLADIIFAHNPPPLKWYELSCLQC